MRDFPDTQLAFFLTLLFIQYASFSDPSDSNQPEYYRPVLLGHGYSTDSQQVTDDACFNATLSKISERMIDLKLYETVSQSDLQRKFGVDLGVTGGYGQFAVDEKAEYIRSLQDDEYSVSVNYYVAHQQKVTVRIDGRYDHALTDPAQAIYRDQNLYQEFGLTCGNNYIATFVQGAVLFAGLEIKLDSKEDKEKLEANVRANYGEFINITSKIQSLSNSNDISGTIQIRAFQFGGDTTKLTNILSENIPYCSIKDTSQCMSVIKALLLYSKEFGNQLSDEGKLEALGPFKYLPIRRLGLIAPNSSVTPKVVQSRTDLATKLKENRYYQRKLSPYVRNKYPVKLQDKLIRHLKSVSNKVEDNLKLIMDPNQGAVQCFNIPEQCEEIKNQIYNNLKNITTDDLKFVKGMKYIFPFEVKDRNLLFYNTGEDLKIWKSVPTSSGSSTTIEMIKFLVSDGSFEYQFKSDGGLIRFNGTWDNIFDFYDGRLNVSDTNFEDFDGHHIQRLKHSPFFFEEYKDFV